LKRGENQLILFMKYTAPPEVRAQRLNMKYLDSLRDICRKNRHNPTSAEEKIWRMLLSKRKTNQKFLRQKPIGRFILDFYCSKLMLAIEIDGDSHNNKQYQDKERDLYLEQRGIKTIRYTNNQVINDIDSIYFDLINKIKHREKELVLSPFQGEIPAKGGRGV